MIQVNILVSWCEHEELGTLGRGWNWNSNVMQQKQNESGSGRGAEWYEGDEARPIQYESMKGGEVTK